MAQRSDLIVNPTSSAPEAVDWVRANGNPYTKLIEREIPERGSGRSDQIVASTLFGTKFDTFELVGSWYFDSRNRAIFADRGLQHSPQLRGHAPGSEVNYYTFRYDYLQPLPMAKQWTVAWSQIAYGDALGDDTSSLPPYRQFFSGGPDSVRGFTESRLGPKDGFGQFLRRQPEGDRPCGAPVSGAGQVAREHRISAFFDIGNVFSQGAGIHFIGQDGRTPVDYQFDYNELKQSAGLAIQWFAPLATSTSTMASR